MSAANKLLIRCAWAGNSEFDSRLASGYIGSSWTSLGACSPAPPPAPPAPPYPPGAAPRPPPDYSKWLCYIEGDMNTDCAVGTEMPLGEGATLNTATSGPCYDFFYSLTRGFGRLEAWGTSRPTGCWSHGPPTNQGYFNTAAGAPVSNAAPVCKAPCNMAGPQEDVTEADLTAGLNCITKYSKPYSDSTSSAEVKQYAVGTSPYAYAILGARYGASGAFKLAALGDYDAVFAATSSSGSYNIPEAGRNRGTYWYHYSTRSMGFAPIPSVQLSHPDIYHASSGSTTAKRLSWYLDTGGGGYRAGSGTMFSAALYKVVLYCNDLGPPAPPYPPGAAPMPPPPSPPVTSPCAEFRSAGSDQVTIAMLAQCQVKFGITASEFFEISAGQVNSGRAMTCPYTNPCVTAWFDPLCQMFGFNQFVGMVYMSDQCTGRSVQM